jgi:hypothetical protein
VSKVSRGKHHLLQTFVFSATLTLPAQLHKRLRKGGGGSSGAASLESLMDRYACVCVCVCWGGGAGGEGGAVGKAFHGAWGGVGVIWVGAGGWRAGGGGPS